MQLFVAGQVVEAGDEQRSLGERVVRPGGLDHVAGEDLEVQVEAVGQLVLPLVDQASGGDDEAPGHVAAALGSGHQLFDQQAGQIALPAPGSSASR